MTNEPSQEALVAAYDLLFEESRHRGFEGSDPFDGLNSGVLRAIPLIRNVPLVRLGFLQLVKRSPVELRGLLKVDEGRNPKGIALFALGEFARATATGSVVHRESALRLLEMLSEAALIPEDGSVAWGYNFDWQSRAFFIPKGTPAIVPTAFAAAAFVKAFEHTGSEEYLETAKGVCRFITGSLNRPVETKDHLCFSYSPVDNSIIFNASLLAAETLASVGAAAGDAGNREMVVRASRFVIDSQDERGAWNYGPMIRHRWVDNFHTAFTLLSLDRISGCIPQIREIVAPAIERGIDFWLEHLFLPDGTPKYYDGRTYPVDIHSAGAAIATLSQLSVKVEDCRRMARKVAAWTINNMRNADGQFAYRLSGHRLDRRVFMRWGNAWMAYALASLIESGSPGSGE